MRQKNWFWVLLIFVIFLVALTAGVIYWTSFKAKKMADSVVDTANKAETVLTPTPTSSISSTPGAQVTMPSADSEGEDLANVSRYPNSIRTAYDKNDDSSVINIEYMVKESSAKILEYYKTTLVQKDWILRAEDPSALSFSGPEADISIEIMSEDKISSISQYQIHYIKITPTEEE